MIKPNMIKYCVLLPVSLLVLALSVKAASETSSANESAKSGGSALTQDLLFGASLKRSNAEWASGNRKIYAHEKYPFGGNGAKLADYHWMRFDAEDNINFRKGTLALQFKPDFDETDTPRIHYLISSRIRSNYWFYIYIDATRDPKELVFWTSTPKSPQILRLPLEKLKNKQWNTLFARWNAETDTLELECEGSYKKQSKKNTVPDIDSKFIMDIFIGGNAKQIDAGPYGPRGVFKGELKNLRIYGDDKIDAKAYTEPLPRLPKLEAQIEFPANAPWLGMNKRRLDFVLNEPKTPAKDKTGQPVRFEIDLGNDWDYLTPLQRMRAILSMRLVRFDPKTGEPMLADSSKTGDDKYYLPFVCSDELSWGRSGILRFKHDGDLPAAYSLFYDGNAPHKDASPKNIPLVGTGDAVKIGQKGEAHIMSASIRGLFDLWDADGDGDLDLWISGGGENGGSADLMRGHYYMENLGSNVFGAPQLIAKSLTPYGALAGLESIQIEDVDGDGKKDVIIFSYATQFWAEFDMKNGKPEISKFHKIDFRVPPVKNRTDFHFERGFFRDFNGDGKLDLLMGQKIYWNVGKDKSDLAFDAENSKNIELPGMRELGLFTSDFEVGDVDGDGIDDIIAGSWITIPQYFKGLGNFKFAPPQKMQDLAGHEIQMPGVFAQPKLRDMDGDGDLDLVWTTESAKLGWNENIAPSPESALELRPSRYVLMHDAYIHPGALCVPVVVDWDNDGDLDIIGGSAMENILFYENIGDNKNPIFADGVPLRADGFDITVRAGPKGSFQGRGENDWFYSNPQVADFDGDGLNDLIVGGVEGRFYIYRNLGPKNSPTLTFVGTVKIDWEGKEPKLPDGLRYTPQKNELVSVHRTRPVVLDWDGDGIADIVTLDTDNELALYRGKSANKNGWTVRAPEKIFDIERPAEQTYFNLRPKRSDKNWNYRGTGRTVNNLIDWDGDGDLDLIWDNVNARLLENVSKKGDEKIKFVDRGNLVRERLIQHNNAPYPVDWNGDGLPDVFVGTESGRIYFFDRRYIEKQCPIPVEVGKRAKQENQNSQK